MAKLELGELVFPTFAAGYSIYMIWQEVDAGLRQSSILYTMAVGIPVLLLCPVVLWGAVHKAKTQPDSKDAPAAPSTALLPAPKVIAFLAITIVTLLLIETVGYAVAFWAFVFASMILLGVRSPLLLAAIPISTVAVVYLVFSMILEMDLPKGVFGNLL